MTVKVATPTAAESERIDAIIAAENPSTGLGIIRHYGNREVLYSRPAANLDVDPKTGFALCGAKLWYLDEE
jgi:hypothetical protein